MYFGCKNFKKNQKPVRVALQTTTRRWSDDDDDDDENDDRAEVGWFVTPRLISIASSSDEETDADVGVCVFVD